VKNFTKSILFIFTLLFTAQFVNAQNTTTYKCKNFYGNGVTEYIQYTPIGPGATKQDKFAYYTSKNSTKINLEVISAEKKESTMGFHLVYTVNFPNDSKKYVLTAMMGGLKCLNPDGTVQDYCTDGLNCN